MPAWYDVLMTYKGFALIPEAFKLPNGKWKLQGAINPVDGSDAGQRFESQNEYPSKEAVEQHFIDFAKRFIDGEVTRADL